VCVRRTVAGCVERCKAESRRRADVVVVHSRSTHRSLPGTSQLLHHPRDDVRPRGAPLTASLMASASIDVVVNYCVEACTDCEVAAVRPRSRPKKTWSAAMEKMVSPDVYARKMLRTIGNGLID